MALDCEVKLPPKKEQNKTEVTFNPQQPALIPDRSGWSRTHVELREPGVVEVQGSGQGQNSGRLIVALRQDQVSAQGTEREHVSPPDGHADTAAPAEQTHGQQLAALHGRAGGAVRRSRRQKEQRPLLRRASTLRGEGRGGVRGGLSDSRPGAGRNIWLRLTRF